MESQQSFLAWPSVCSILFSCLCGEVVWDYCPHPHPSKSCSVEEQAELQFHSIHDEASSLRVSRRAYKYPHPRGSLFPL